MITVYHNKKFIDFSFLDDKTIKEKAKKIPAADLVKVAEVQTTDLDKAFELTNNITRQWTNNDGVKGLIGPTRSTSTGDVMETKNGKCYIVAACGFVEI